MSRSPVPSAIVAQTPTSSALRATGAPWFMPHNPGTEFFAPEQWVAIGEALDLSARELAVLVLIFEGHTRETIAHRLHKADGSCLSVETVRVFMDRLFEKAKVSDKVSLILRVMRIHRMLETP